MCAKLDVWLLLGAKPRMPGIHHGTLGGGIVAYDACPGSGDALKPSFVVGKRGCKNDVKGLVEELLVMGAKTMWAT